MKKNSISLCYTQSADDFGFIMNIKPIILPVALNILCGPGVAMACEFPASLHEALVRFDTEDRHARESKWLEEMTLFSGIMLHAMNAMSGEQEIFFRENCIPMLSDAMERYVYDMYSKADVVQIEACLAFIHHIKIVAAGLPERDAWSIAPVSRKVIQGYDVLAGCFDAELCRMASLLSLNCANYCRAASRDMISMLKISSMSRQSDGSQLYLWVDFSPVRESSHFFVSPECRDCLSAFASADRTDEQVFLCSIREMKKYCRDQSALVDRARQQQEMIHIHGSLFMKNLLHAFKAFQSRIELGSCC